MVMASEWVKLTVKGDKQDTYVNLMNASAIFAKGEVAEIWFLSGSVKVFGRRPFVEGCRGVRERPAFENLQRRKPRVGKASMWRVLSMGI
jgi:hypothetical protein